MVEKERKAERKEGRKIAVTADHMKTISIIVSNSSSSIVKVYASSVESSSKW